MSKYIIYCLIDPKTKLIRYIGRSSSGLRRPKSHLRGKGTSRVDNWIRSLLRENLKPTISVIESFEYSDNINDILNEAEVFWISFMKLFDIPLTNLTEGGEGILGFKHSKETKKKIGKANSIALKGKEYPGRWKFKICRTCKEKYRGTAGGNKFCSPKCFYSYPCTEEKREKNRKASSGKNNPMYGKTGKDAPRFGVCGKEHPLFGKRGKLCKNSLKVRCIQTGEIFYSMREAGEFAGVSSSIISAICKNLRGPTRKGLSFELVK